jgi:hypothetical protein
MRPLLRLRLRRNLLFLQEVDPQVKIEYSSHGVISHQREISYQSKSLWCKPSTEMLRAFVAMAESAAFVRTATHTEMMCVHD